MNGTGFILEKMESVLYLTQIGTGSNLVGLEKVQRSSTISIKGERRENGV